MKECRNLIHSFDMDIVIRDDGWFNLILYEPESGLTQKWEFPISCDEHPEFNETIGNEIYSWISLWSEAQYG